jgi:hypothetical protein
MHMLMGWRCGGGSGRWRMQGVSRELLSGKLLDREDVSALL